MAQKISELLESSGALADSIAVVNEGTTKRMTLESLKTLINEEPPPQEIVFTYGGRFYLRNNLYYSFNTTYGLNYYHVNSSVGISPNYRFKGFEAPFNGKLKKVIVEGYPNFTVDFELFINKQISTDQDTNVSNEMTSIHKIKAVANKTCKHIIDCEISLKTGDKFAPVLKRFNTAETTTRYLYASMIFLFEKAD